MKCGALDWIYLNKYQMKVNKTVFLYVSSMCMSSVYVYKFSNLHKFSTRKSRKTTENDKLYIYFNII